MEEEVETRFHSSQAKIRGNGSWPNIGLKIAPLATICGDFRDRLTQWRIRIQMGFQNEMDKSFMLSVKDVRETRQILC